jgi:hypothetical protein
VLGFFGERINGELGDEGLRELDVDVGIGEEDVGLERVADCKEAS